MINLKVIIYFHISTLIYYLMAWSMVLKMLKNYPGYSEMRKFNFIFSLSSTETHIYSFGSLIPIFYGSSYKLFLC